MISKTLWSSLTELSAARLRAGSASQTFKAGDELFASNERVLQGEDAHVQIAVVMRGEHK